MKICILENFSKFEVKFVSISSKSYRLYNTSTQQRSIFYWEHWPKKYTKIFKNNKIKKHATANTFVITSFKLRRGISQ